MKFSLTIIFSLIISFLFAQQNLVPNWSFEDTISCPQPQGAAFYSYTPPWFSPTLNTPDILNECTPWPNNIPYNNGTFQYARTGKGMADFIWNYSWSCDYLSIKLLSPLNKNEKYCVEFYVNLENWAYLAIDRIGAYISLDSIHISTYSYLPFIPQIENPAGNIITDTLNWTLISGEYIASGGEQYITIGCFGPDSLVQTVVNDSIHGDFTHYCLDDVSVYYCGDDTTGINGIKKSEINFTVFPNPATNELTIDFTLTDKSYFELYDLIGTKRKAVTLDSGSQTKRIDLTDIVSGLYFYSVVDMNGNRIKTGKLIVIK
jgi:hypothetical protein